jgi:iron complex outermembrane recepter protein
MRISTRPFNLKPLALACLSVSLGGGTSAVLAQGKLEEIVVTARKRVESLQDVPVTVNVVTAAMMDRLRVEGIEDLATQIPGLQAGETTSSSGGRIVMRGIGSAEESTLIDQAVSINIDGVPVNDARLLQASLMDMEQVEVLKGPQALFWGKNSPGGVIAIHSADPTDEFEMKVTGSYETAAKERGGNIMMSGPMGETVSGRVVFAYSKQDGLYDIVAPQSVLSYTNPANGASTPVAFPLQKSDTYKDGHKLFFRGTLLFQPTDAFDAKLKYSYSDIEFIGGEFRTGQRVHCPFGRAQAMIQNDNCKADDKIHVGSMDPAQMALNRYTKSNEPDGIMKTKTYLGSFEMNYEIPNSDLTLSSVTGYYKSSQFWQGDATFEQASNLFNTNTPWAEQWSEELRIASNWDSGFNFTGGLYWEDRKNEQRGLQTTIRIAPLVGVLPGGILNLGWDEYSQKTKSWSAFLQLSWDITDRLNLSGGGRYSKDKKSLERVFFGNPVLLTKPKESWDNLSPELTLSFKANPNVMVFASYREGYKSGGFDGAFAPALATPGLVSDLRYNEEQIKGFEIGAKTNWMDDTLRANLSIYSYKYDDMQLGNFDPATVTLHVVNAAKSKIEGVELEFNWATPVEGLQVIANLNYLDATFDEFLGDCFTGQTIALGCNQVFNGTNFLKQDLKGERLPFAAEWTGALGLTYETPVGQGWHAELSGYATYQGKYETITDYLPGSTQKGYWLSNASVSVFSPNDTWEVFLKGTNLADKFWHMRSYANPLTGGGFGTTTATLADVGATVSGGRRITLGLTWHM